MQNNNTLKEGYADRTVTKEVQEILQMQEEGLIEGTLVPVSWFKHLIIKKYDSKTGKVVKRPDLTAIVLLSEILYWYRPEKVFENGSLVGHKRKFDGGLPQLSYVKNFESKYGFTKKQSRDALKRLEDLKLIERIFEKRVKTSKGRDIYNVMYIRLYPSRLRRITTKMTQK